MLCCACVCCAACKGIIPDLRLTYDNVTRHEEQDLSTVVGLLLGILQVLRLRKGALLWLGVPCSSFGFMSSSVHKRTWRDPLGDIQRSFVSMGNVLSARACLLAALAMVRKSYYFIEHPQQSMLQAFPYVRFLLCLDYLGAKISNGVTTRWWPACSLLSSLC